MTIIKLLFFKYSFSFFVCLFSCIVIFFIFSLLGNFGENYLFNTIIQLSLLNSLQIIILVPSFVFLLSVILFMIFLRSKNEIIIIKSYFSINKFILFFLPIVVIFTLFEINKNNLVLFLEDSKNILLKQNEKIFTKIVIDNKNNFKSVTLFNSNNPENLDGLEYRAYKIKDKRIYEAQFSNNITISNNLLIAENYTEYKNNLIKKYEIQKVIDINFIDLMKQSTIVKNISINGNFKINLKLINLLVYYLLFFSFIFLIFANKKFINSKESLIYPIFISIILMLYSFLIFNNSLNLYKQELEFLASLIIGMFVLKERINE